jgi:uncharacterized membrane protein
MNEREWMLRRNCSLSPRQLGIAFAVLCALTLMVAAVFVLHGAWIVLYFSVLELTVAAVAFLVYARHATDYEHLALMEGCLLIEQVQAGNVRQARLDPCWTHIVFPPRPRALINLEARGVSVEIGRYVTESKRRQIAQELRQALRALPV